MSNPARDMFIEKVHDGILTGKGAEEQGRNEPGGVPGHDDPDPEALFLEASEDLTRLVNADRGRDAQGHDL
jgi:hypothetical protein